MPRQLEMDFGDRRNRFKDSLDSGVFVVLIEIDSPAEGDDWELAISNARELENVISKIDSLPVALAFTQKFDCPDSWDLPGFASEVCDDNKDWHLVYLSGRNTSLEKLIENAKVCAGAGFRNIVPVSGELMEKTKDLKPGDTDFTESVHLLRALRSDKNNSSLFPGCVTNPFKYTPNDLLGQFHKLVKKINLGSNFIVTQLGWDMMKLQELRWYLSFRGTHYPSIARIPYLSPEQSLAIAEEKYPGVHISPDFQLILRNEARHSHRQFESAQWRRLQMQVAGCKLLGYSGVQISGLNSPSQVHIACRRVAEALNEFEDFKYWKNSYFEHIGRSEMAPYPHRFYLFNKLFSSAHLDQKPVMNRVPKVSKSILEHCKYKAARLFLADSLNKSPSSRVFTKKILTGCPSCESCRLDLTHYVCLETCPKKLSNGPCGGTRANGDCEYGGMECVHAKRVRIANWRNETDQLEDCYVPPSSEL